MYEKTHSYLGAATLDLEEGYNATLGTGFLARYEMTVRLQIRSEFIFDKTGRITGQKWIANLSASSYVSAGKLADIKPWVKAQMLVDGKPTPIISLAVSNNPTLYWRDSQHSFVGEAEWEIPTDAKVQILYEGSRLVNGWQTPSIGHAVNPVPIIAAGNIGYLKIISGQ
ncbi:MAG: hypothetical protein ACOYXT_29925 [Bacteroidota bacterium]